MTTWFQERAVDLEPGDVIRRTGYFLTVTEVTVTSSNCTIEGTTHLGTPTSIVCGPQHTFDVQGDDE